uniref:Uncharacterized protein n=1 Tax=Cacopsylla melanoneura TaxID=428564 RepID=A0A8D9E845_9HEMI
MYNCTWKLLHSSITFLQSNIHLFTSLLPTIMIIKSSFLYLIVVRNQLKLKPISLFYCSLESSEIKAHHCSTELVKLKLISLPQTFRRRVNFLTKTNHRSRKSSKLRSVLILN